MKFEPLFTHYAVQLNNKQFELMYHEEQSENIIDELYKICYFDCDYDHSGERMIFMIESKDDCKIPELLTKIEELLGEIK